MKKVSFLTIFIFTIASLQASAATTSGYAWSESLGWFDFSDVIVEDSGLSGHAYNDNTGWLVMSGVSNSGGELSGYAWSESVGYFDFSNVTITGGSFDGYAYNDNTGWLSFETGTNVSTAWTESSTPPVEDEEEEQPRRRGSRKLPVNPPVPASAIPMPTSAIPGGQKDADFIFGTSDFQVGSMGEGVRILQGFLNEQGFLVNSVPGGPGSPGYETNYFGGMTRDALARFQSAKGIQPSVGYFGPKTRAFIMTLVSGTN